MSPVTQIGQSSTSTEATSTNPLENITYSKRVEDRSENSKDAFHSFPSIVDNYGSYGVQRDITGNDGQPYTKLTIPGYYHGRDG